ncbi:glycosyltransferase family 4 protein [Parabacteroides faecis]|uniref:glycosyltransferase family 4 protein n=1 Tax=Parabacteroides faecis TaxID=1217282 RepID=UPI00216430D7|nr:glycosyltransferase family 4 protein [Parabacteroides faecis]MCS2892499.1 glycosyltransferase family 4 protein [Parabacteroides faecis]UVQ48865.1 glycosyltransferase family 4 protein [Parabacteroides faecis]
MKKIKKICILSNGKLPVPITEGGAVENLIDMMAECYVTGNYNFSLDIISIYSEKSKQLSDSIQKIKYIYIKTSPFISYLYAKISNRCIRYFRFDPIFLLSYLRKATSIIKKNQYDIIIIENKASYVEYLSRHTNAKIIPHLHNDIINNTTFRNQQITSKSTLILTVSDFIKKRVETVQNLSTPVVTIPNVIDIKKFMFSEREIQLSYRKRTEMGFTDDDIVCAFIGRVHPTKGVDKLIEAISQVGLPNLKLMIVGGSFFANSKDTPYVKKLKELSDKIKDRIKFTGYIDYNDIPLYYGISDIIVVPSQWDDPAPLTVFEAQASGKPLIASDSGGIKEYVSPNVPLIRRDSSFVDNLANEIMKLAKDKALRTEIGKKNKEYIARHDKRIYLDRIVNAIYNH